MLVGSLLMLLLVAPKAVAEDGTGYEAHYEIIWQQPATTYNMTVYFDGKKKLCSEQFNPKGELEIKHFFDLEKETMVTLYPQIDITTALEQEANLDQFVWRMLESQKKNFTSLGKKKVGQWECDGWKQTLDKSGKPVEERSAIELWTMADSGCGVLSKQMGAVTMNLKEYKPKAPAASTFELPDGCKVET